MKVKILVILFSLTINIQSKHLLFKEEGRSSYEELIEHANNSNENALNQLLQAWQDSQKWKDKGEALQFEFIGNFLRSKGYSKEEIINKLEEIKKPTAKQTEPKIPQKPGNLFEEIRAKQNLKNKEISQIEDRIRLIEDYKDKIEAKNKYKNELKDLKIYLKEIKTKFENKTITTQETLEQLNALEKGARDLVNENIQLRNVRKLAGYETIFWEYENLTKHEEPQSDEENDDDEWDNEPVRPQPRTQPRPQPKPAQHHKTKNQMILDTINELIDLKNDLRLTLIESEKLGSYIKEIKEKHENKIENEDKILNKSQVLRHDVDHFINLPAVQRTVARKREGFNLFANYEKLNR